MTASQASAFDEIIDRRTSSSTKWQKYAGQDVLPFWVADMDFATPPFIRNAIAERLQHPILGYTDVPETLIEQACAWVHQRYQWQIDADWLVWLPGVVAGLNLAARAMAGAGQQLAIPTPVYFPFLDIAHNQGLAQQTLELTLAPLDNRAAVWQMDFDAMAAQLAPNTRVFMLCNPQNPTGRCYTRQELEQLIDFCQQQDLLLCSDEIHADLILSRDAQHHCIAALDPEFAQRTITLYAPTKTYNMPGLSCAFAVIPDPLLREKFRAARAGLVHGPSTLAYAAASAAFTHSGEWLQALLDYLRGNHEQVLALANGELPGCMAPVEATYLAWLNLSQCQHPNLEQFWVQQGLALSDGAAFGSPGFTRFNFACPRPLLEQGLERLQRGLRQLAGT